MILVRCVDIRRSSSGRGSQRRTTTLGAETDRLLDRMASRFIRLETRRARGFLLGLLADLPRKNCWTIAEHAGDTAAEKHPYLQRFLARPEGRSRCSAGGEPRPDRARRSLTSAS